MDTFCRLFVAPQFVQAPLPHPSIGDGFKLQCNRENREHLKNLRNVYCVMTNHSEDWPQNQKKLINILACGLVFSRLIGFSLARQ